MTTLPDTAKQVLSSAIELISDPEKWTKEVCARDKQGEEICYHSPTACSWCAYGALWKYGRGLKVVPLITEAFKEKFEESISIVNDSSREEIISKLKQLL